MLTPCQECQRTTRPRRSAAADYPPGTIRMHARGLCDRCYSAWQRGTLGNTPAPERVTTRTQRVEDLEWLLRYDHNAESVARRAGFTNATSAVRTLQRWGHHDLANTLRHYQAGIDVYKQDHYTAA